MAEAARMSRAGNKAAPPPFLSLSSNRNARNTEGASANVSHTTQFSRRAALGGGR